MSLVNIGTKRQFNRTKYVFKIWFNQSEKGSIVDVWLGSKYGSVNTTLHLTFLKSLYKVYSLYKVNEIF